MSKIGATCVRPVLADGSHDPAWWDTDDHVGPIPGLDMCLPYGDDDTLAAA